MYMPLRSYRAYDTSRLLSTPTLSFFFFFNLVTILPVLTEGYTKKKKEKKEAPISFWSPRRGEGTKTK